MDGGPTVEGSLDALVSGKRSSPRHAVSMPALVKGARGEFHGEMIDVSLDGARITIPVSELGGTPGEPLGPAEQFGLLEAHFRDSFDIHVPERGVVMEAEVVRLVVTADNEDAVELGCRFVLTLTDKQQRQLGLLSSDESLVGWGDALHVHDVRWAADPGRPITALLVDEHEDTRGPLFLGPVGAIGRRAVLVRLWGIDEEAAMAALAGPGVRVRVLQGRTALTEAACEPVSARYIDSPRAGVELLFALAAPLPRAVRKHFRRR